MKVGCSWEFEISQLGNKGTPGSLAQELRERRNDLQITHKSSLSCQMCTGKLMH